MTFLLRPWRRPRDAGRRGCRSFAPPACGVRHAAAGLVGAAMLPMAELEYTGITIALETLQSRFTVRR
jgi:hypothetical protein